MNVIMNLLVVTSGICWSIVYIECIRKGFKEKTYCMPLFALGLNIAWEGIYAFTDLFVRHNIGAQAIANSVWFILDIVIVVTWFKYGKNSFDSKSKQKWFISWTVIVIASCFVLQLLFMFQFGSIDGEKYSAFLQNIIMSVAFLNMLDTRKSTKGQSMTIAICKCIGTLTPTILGTIEGNVFILVTGSICFIFDLMYIFMFKKVGSTNFLKNSM